MSGSLPEPAFVLVSRQLYVAWGDKANSHTGPTLKQSGTHRIGFAGVPILPRFPLDFQHYQETEIKNRA
jgi:hypothetical protein